MQIFKLIIFICLMPFCSMANGNEFYNKAQEAKRTNNTDGAITYLKQALEQEPQNVSYAKELSSLLFSRKKYADAIPVYKMLHTAEPQEAIYVARLIEMYSYLNNMKEIIALSQSFKMDKLSDPEKVKFLSTIGDCYFKVNYFPMAIANYKKCLEYSPSNTQDINLRIGRCYTEINSFDEASAYYEKSIIANTKDHKRIMEMAMNYYYAGNLSKAIENYLLAGKNGAPQDLIYLFNLANLYYEANDFKNAIYYLGKSKEISPFDQDIASLTAYCYYKNDMTEEARGVIKEMLKVNPNNGDLIYLMGLTYQKDGNKERAESYFEKSFKAKPALESLRVSMMKF